MYCICISIPLFSLSYCPAIENDTCALWQSCSCFVYHAGLGYILFAERLAKKPANCPQAVLVCTLYTRDKNVCSGYPAYEVKCLCSRAFQLIFESYDMKTL